MRKYRMRKYVPNESCEEDANLFNLFFFSHLIFVNLEFHSFHWSIFFLLNVSGWPDFILSY